ncbi:MAG: hypothetical protein PHU85_18075 [Phycisphaerae bacterium]|nr:hypothetical protein [Phycisphaerae bacterium]
MAKVSAKRRREIRKNVVHWAMEEHELKGKWPTKAQVKAQVVKEAGADAGAIDPAFWTMIIQLIMQIIAMFKK